MIFKVFFRTSNGRDWEDFCKVLAVENGQELEKRIATIESNLKADGCKGVTVKDCFNISRPTERPY